MYNHSKISSQTQINLPPTTENVTNQLQELYEMVAILSGGTETLNDDVIRLSTESICYKNALDPFTQDLSTLKVSTQEQNACIDGIKTNQEILQQDVASMEQKVKDMKSNSYDGTFIWKITNVEEKMGQQLRNMMLYSVERVFIQYSFLIH
jgi:hypothetical protein